MKITIILLILVNTAFAQAKKDNVIIAGHVPYNALKGIMFENGYTLENTDTVYISTTNKDVEGGSVSVKFRITRTDTTTVITALGRSTINLVFGGVSTPSDFTKVYFGGMKSSPLRNAWNEFDKMAKLLSPVVNYSKR